MPTQNDKGRGGKNPNLNAILLTSFNFFKKLKVQVYVTMLLPWSKFLTLKALLLSPAAAPRTETFLLENRLRFAGSKKLY